MKTSESAPFPPARFCLALIKLSLFFIALSPQSVWPQQAITNSVASGVLAPRSQAPFKSQMVSPIPRATQFELEQWHWAFSITPTSIFSSDFGAQGALNELDYYSIEYRFDAHYTPHPNWQLGASLAYRTSDSAGLDQTTLSFHKAFGFDQNGRDLVSRDRYFIRFPNAQYQLTHFSHRLLSRQYELSASYAFWQQPQHQASTTFSVQYHDDALFNRDGSPWDLAWQIDYAYQHQQHRFSTMLARSQIGTNHLFSVPVRSSYWHSALGYRYWLSAAHHLSLNYHLSEGVGGTIGAAGGSVHEVNFGYHYQHKAWGLDFVIMQNTINADSSADIALHFRVSRHFHVN